MENKSDKSCLPTPILPESIFCASAFMCCFVGFTENLQFTEKLDCSASGLWADGKGLTPK